MKSKLVFVIVPNSFNKVKFNVINIINKATLSLFTWNQSPCDNLIPLPVKGSSSLTLHPKSLRAALASSQHAALSTEFNSSSTPRDRRAVQSPLLRATRFLMAKQATLCNE